MTLRIEKADDDDTPAIRLIGRIRSAHLDALSAELRNFPRRATIDLAELQDFCRDHLARYKCPTAYAVVDQLPVGLTGKILRRALR